MFRTGLQEEVDPYFVVSLWGAVRRLVGVFRVPIYCGALAEVAVD